VFKILSHVFFLDIEPDDETEMEDFENQPEGKITRLLINVSYRWKVWAFRVNSTHFGIKVYTSISAYF